MNLHLIYGYRNAAKDWSSIAFTKIALDNFTHVSGAIATEIDEVPITKMPQEIGDNFVEWNQMYGSKFWKATLQNYTQHLVAAKYRAWSIAPAIGFSGFVIAKEVGECS